MSFYRYVPYDPISKRYFWAYSRSNKKEIVEMIHKNVTMYESFTHKRWIIEKNRWKRVEIARIRMERVTND